MRIRKVALILVAAVQPLSVACAPHRIGTGASTAPVAKSAGTGQESLLARRRDSTWRAVASWMLCKYGGRTQREVAAILGAKTGVAISCQLKKLRRSLAEDAELHSQVAKLEKVLQGRR